MTNGTHYGVIYKVRDGSELRLWYSSLFPVNERNKEWAERDDIVSFQLVKFSTSIDTYLHGGKYTKVGTAWKTKEEYRNYYNIIITLLQ